MFQNLRPSGAISNDISKDAFLDNVFCLKFGATKKQSSGDTIAIMFGQVMCWH